MKNKLDYHYMSPIGELNLFIVFLVNLKKKISRRKSNKEFCQNT